MQATDHNVCVLQPLISSSSPPSVPADKAKLKGGIGMASNPQSCDCPNTQSCMFVEGHLMPLFEIVPSTVQCRQVQDQDSWTKLRLKITLPEKLARGRASQGTKTQSLCSSDFVDRNTLIDKPVWFERTPQDAAVPVYMMGTVTQIRDTEVPDQACVRLYTEEEHWIGVDEAIQLVMNCGKLNVQYKQQVVLTWQSKVGRILLAVR
jgi:hypothetical protein